MDFIDHPVIAIIEDSNKVFYMDGGKVIREAPSDSRAAAIHFGTHWFYQRTWKTPKIITLKKEEGHTFLEVT
jgi:hypothetical protein